MNKFKILLLCMLLFLCAGCGETSLPQPSTDTSVEEEDAPIYLELHFGKGEVLKKEIEHLLVPRSSGGIDSTFSISPGSYWGEETWCFTPIWRPFTSNLASYTTAVFPDGTKYAMTEIKSTEADLESRTLIAYLWRDEPYQTEREYFDTVLESEEFNE